VEDAAQIKNFPTWQFADGSRLEGAQPLAVLGQKLDAVCHDIPPAAHAGYSFGRSCRVVVSSVSLYHHFSTSKTSFCNFGESFNCDIVNRSSYSMLAGVPVALIGVIGIS